MLFQKKITLTSLALWLTAAPSPSAALLKRHRVITDLADSVIDERLFTDWQSEKQKINRKGIDLEAIERDLEERRWLKSGSYSYSEDSDSKKSTTYSSKDSEDSGYKPRDDPEGCKFLGKMYDPGEWIDLENDKCKCDEGGSTNWVNCELLGNVATDDGGKDGGVQLDCKFEGKMYDPGQWIDLGTEKCKCDEGGSSTLVECEKYKIDGEGEGGEGEDTLPPTTSGDEGGVTVEPSSEANFFSKVDSDDGEIKPGLDGCPSAGVVNTNSIVVNFAYMVKIKPIDAAGTLAMYTEIERKIFDSLASEIVDCSEESPKIAVAKSKESERNLEVMLTDSYPDDQVVGTCNGVQNCFIVHGAITVTYTENETKEYATLYTMKTIKKKMDSGEFNNQGDIISVEYLGKPDKFSDVKSREPTEPDTNKWTMHIVLICSVLFLTLASFLAKILYDSKRNSEKNNETYMEENNDFLVEESVDENLAKILYHSKRNSEKNNETSMEENNDFAIEDYEKLAKILYDSKSSSEKSNEISMEENNDYLVEVPFDEKLPRMEDVDISIEEPVDEKLPGMGVDVV